MSKLETDFAAVAPAENPLADIVARNGRPGIEPCRTRIAGASPSVAIVDEIARPAEFDSSRWTGRQAEPPRETVTVSGLKTFEDARPIGELVAAIIPTLEPLPHARFDDADAPLLDAETVFRDMDPMGGPAARPEICDCTAYRHDLIRRRPYPQF